MVRAAIPGTPRESLNGNLYHVNHNGSNKHTHKLRMIPALLFITELCNVITNLTPFSRLIVEVHIDRPTGQDRLRREKPTASSVSLLCSTLGVKAP